MRDFVLLPFLFPKRAGVDGREEKTVTHQQTVTTTENNKREGLYLFVGGLLCATAVCIVETATLDICVEGIEVERSSHKPNPKSVTDPDTLADEETLLTRAYVLGVLVALFVECASFTYFVARYRSIVSFKTLHMVECIDYHLKVLKYFWAPVVNAGILVYVGFLSIYVADSGVVFCNENSNDGRQSIHDYLRVSGTAALMFALVQAGVVFLVVAFTCCYTWEPHCAWYWYRWVDPEFFQLLLPAQSVLFNLFWQLQFLVLAYCFGCLSYVTVLVSSAAVCAGDMLSYTGSFIMLCQ